MLTWRASEQPGRVAPLAAPAWRASESRRAREADPCHPGSHLRHRPLPTIVAMRAPGPADEDVFLGDPPADEVTARASEMFVLLCSLLNTVTPVIVALPGLGTIQQVAFLTDVGLTIVFLAELLYRLGTAPRRRE